jgi:hypothetical protein
VIERLTVVCDDHDAEQLVGRLERRSSSLWFLLPSSRAFKHSSGAAEAEGVDGRYRLLCGACLRERRDQPLVIRSEKISAAVDQLPADALPVDPRGFTILTRRMLRSLADR